MIRTCVTTWLLMCGMTLAAAGEAGQDASPASDDLPTASAADKVGLPFAYDGPPAPVPPEVITRDGSGRATVRAVRLASPIRLDGRLDEEVYTSVPSFSGFIQMEPQAGSPATQQTEVWVTFDREHVYVTARCWESHPERMVVNEMRRDGASFFQTEHIVFVFDTFYDRRNGLIFAANAIGGRGDGQLTNERQYNRDWNTVWDVAVGRFEGGWTAEFAIPFKSLRYRPGRAQIWGFNMERVNMWKNERSVLTPIPAAIGQRSIMQVSLAATLVGLDVPPGSKNLEIKPYAISNLTSDVNATPQVVNDLGGDLGLDVKYGLTQNLTADLTYNTDFAQVEADEQQINLTRFSLFFPEKREFFLENQGTFGFGGAATSGGQAGSSDTPILFYSRRIGLNQGRVVPIQAGGRLTGRVGRFNVGVLNIRADEEALSAIPATNFAVIRLRRDILRRSSVGILYTGRSVGQTGGPRNDAYGVDGTFAFFDNLALNAYWARTETPGLSREDASYRVHMDYAGDRYGVQMERLLVGQNFNPESGFVRRPDMLRHFGQFRFSPRPRQSDRVRKFVWTGSFAHIENGAGRLETRTLEGEFAIQFQNSDQFTLRYTRAYEFFAQPFRVAPDITLPVAGYSFDNVLGGFNFGRHRPISGNVTVERGSFYNGDKTAVALAAGRMSASSRLSIEPSLSFNWVNLRQGSFTTTLVGSRVTHTMTPHMFASALVQYNSSNNTLAANVRLRWEYQPGSELFVVYNEQRDTLMHNFPALANRAVIVKINRLFRF